MIVTQDEAALLGCPLRVTRRAMTMDELTAAFVPGQLGKRDHPDDIRLCALPA